jgi:L-ribulose-5-phosphate 4-epimerase
VQETEGIIKYRLDFKASNPVQQDICELNSWRSIMYALGLIGQQEDRYLGYGFGNLSQRSVDKSELFIISASQTGYLPKLDASHYTLIEAFDIASNRIQASGCLPPSSEALSHAMIYQLNPAIQSVFHIHDPLLWKFGLQHDYPTTSVDVEYGTVAMAHEVQRLYQHSDLKDSGTLMMGGHEDGVIVFGENMQESGMRLIQLWVAAHTVCN